MKAKSSKIEIKEPKDMMLLKQRVCILCGKPLFTLFEDDVDEQYCNTHGKIIERIKDKARKQTLEEVLKDIIETKKAWKQIKRKKPLYETAKHMILLLENWQHVYELKLKEASEPSGSDLEQKLRELSK
jgi:N-acyl-D-aspartate/D-glutamate deacylase